MTIVVSIERERDRLCAMCAMYVCVCVCVCVCVYALNTPYFFHGHHSTRIGYLITNLLKPGGPNLPYT
jgi:hypothetical protein